MKTDAQPTTETLPTCEDETGQECRFLLVDELTDHDNAVGPISDNLPGDAPIRERCTAIHVIVLRCPDCGGVERREWTTCDGVECTSAFWQGEREHARRR